MQQWRCPMSVSFSFRLLLLCGLAASFLVADTLPPAQEIVARYDQALGGRAAILRHTSCTMRGTLEVRKPEGSVFLPFVFYAMAPYRRLEKITLPKHAGDNLSGFDGENAWGLDPRNGAQVLTGNDRESAKRDADFYYPLTELSWFKSMQTVGPEEFEARPCYRLHGINNWNKSNDHFYDRETGLLVGYEFETTWRSGKVWVHEIFSDYQKIDGVLFPMKQTVKIRPENGGEWTVAQIFAYSSVTFNDVDSSIFAPPKAVRDLLMKPAARPAGL